jgi:Sulfotransferase domain
VTAIRDAGVLGLRAGARAIGTISYGLRELPDFLVVGGQRCGTTSLFKTLVEHPAVVPPLMHKGIHYFDMQYERGLHWYRGQFPTRATRALVSRRGGQGAITGESSPYYGFHPLGPTRIAQDLPSVRVILLVRDPVERAFSAYKHETARGFESEPFEVALDLEADRTEGERERMLADPSYLSFSLQHHAYTERGRYVEQWERLAAALGPDRVLVVDSHRLFSGARDAMDEVLGFLELSPVPGLTFGQHNARPSSPMPDAPRIRLEEHFAPYDLRLAEVLGGKPTWMT